MVRNISKRLFKAKHKGVSYLRLIFLFTLLSCSDLYAQADDFKIFKNEAIEGNEFKKNNHNLNDLTVFDLEYKSFDKTKVKGFIISPNDTSKKYPVVVYNRGGNGSYGMVTEPYLIRFLCRLAKKGYIVIGSQLRGSEGSEGVDEWGGKDIDDVLALFPIIDKIKGADTSKIAQVGWSRGGITNFHILKRSSRIKTTVNIAGPANILKTHRSIMFTVYKNRIKNYEKDSLLYANRVSPIFKLDSLKNRQPSILYIHGDKDTQVLINNSYELYEKSKQNGFKTELVVFPGGDHSLREHFEKLTYEIDLWFRRELIGE